MDNLDLILWNKRMRAAPLGHGGGSYRIVNAELTTYTTGLTTALSTSQLRNLDTFITSLKTGLSITNLSDAFDVMYVLAGETSESSLRNLVKNAHHATAVNSPTFTKYEGFKGNGTTSYIDTNYNPSTQGSRFKQNDASIGVYTRDSIKDKGAPTGLTSSSSQSVLVVASTTLYYGCNSSSPSKIIHDGRAGLYTIYRSAAAATFARVNKIALASSATASVAPISGNFWICGRNKTDAAGTYNNNQIAFQFLGKSLSTTHADIIVDAIEAYMDANGKGVIS